MADGGVGFHAYLDAWESDSICLSHSKGGVVRLDLDRGRLGLRHGDARLLRLLVVQGRQGPRAALLLADVHARGVRADRDALAVRHLSGARGFCLAATRARVARYTL